MEPTSRLFFALLASIAAVSTGCAAPDEENGGAASAIGTSPAMLKVGVYDSNHGTVTIRSDAGRDWLNVDLGDARCVVDFESHLRRFGDQRVEAEDCNVTLSPTEAGFDVTGKVQQREVSDHFIARRDDALKGQKRPRFISDDDVDLTFLASTDRQLTVSLRIQGTELFAGAAFAASSSFGDRYENATAIPGCELLVDVERLNGHYVYFVSGKGTTCPVLQRIVHLSLESPSQVFE